MNNFNILYESIITKVSKDEIKFYFEEIIGVYGIFDTFYESSQQNNHIKFSNVIFSFVYKNKYWVKCFSNPGEDSSKSDNGSISAVILVYDDLIKKDKISYIHKESNAWYNPSTKNVDYDPIIRTGKELLIYVKTVLDKFDNNGENDDFVPPNNPINKNTIHKTNKNLVNSY